MNLEERINAVFETLSLDGFRWRAGDGEEPEYNLDVTEANRLLKQLLRDVVEAVKPKRNGNGYESGEVLETGDGRLSVHEAARWGATDYDRAIDEMEAKARELGL